MGEAGPLSESCVDLGATFGLYHLSLLRSTAGGSGTAPPPGSPGRQLLRMLQLLAQPHGGAGPRREFGQR